MNPKIYSNINNYLIIYTPKVIPWGQTDKQTNKRTHGQIFTQYLGISSHSMGACIANIFCFGAFADQQSGIVYNYLTGNFPFMSYDGKVCYLVVYHYKSNTILALLISGLDDKTIFDAYKSAFD
jgi:hypothetical protein